MYCGKWRKSRSDLDLDRTMPNVELVRAIFNNYNMFKFQVDLNHYFLSYRVHRYTHTQRQADTQTDMSTL